MSHVAVLCLGSNVTGAVDKLLRAVDAFGEWGDSEVTRPYSTGNSYLNCVMRLTTEFDADTINIRAKQIEKMLGRRPGMKEQGIVPIDIDLVIFDGEILRPADADSIYFTTGVSLL